MSTLSKSTLSTARWRATRLTTPRRTMAPRSWTLCSMGTTRPPSSPKTAASDTEKRWVLKLR